MSGSGFQISIIAGKDEQSSSVTASGQIQNVITDGERDAFQINDPELMEALIAGNGKTPKGAWLRDPTPPVGTLFGTYNWEQTSTVMSITSAEILGITSEPVILKTQEFENSSSVEATFNVSISDTVTDSSSSEWSTGGSLTVGQSISYEVSFLGSGVGGETSLAYSQEWGEGGTHSTEVMVGSESGVEVTLQPGQSVIASLTASRGVMRVRVHYNAKLRGYTAVYYDDSTYKNIDYYSFWTPTVMSNTNISNSVDSTEDIEIGYFSNGNITLMDGATKEIMESFNVESPLLGNQESIVKK